MDKLQWATATRELVKQARGARWCAVAWNHNPDTGGEAAQALSVDELRALLAPGESGHQQRASLLALQASGEAGKGGSLYQTEYCLGKDGKPPVRLPTKVPHALPPPWRN